jgi:hypothetical protein
MAREGRHRLDKESRTCATTLRSLFRSSTVAVCIPLLCAAILCGCGKYPQPVDSARDIAQLPPDTEMLSIPLLPVEAYPQLTKFTNLHQISFYHPNGAGADNTRLQKLARLHFKELRDISLLNCPMVTDDGVLSLTNITSLRFLQLEGTAITDASLYGIRSNLWIKGLNVANCDKVTFKGLSVVLELPSLEEISFSVTNIDQSQALALISQFHSINHCEIVDPGGKLDIKAVNQAAASKQARVLLRREGALETIAKK